MHRITITIDDDLLTEVDRLVAKRGYQNRSEAIRDLARGGLAQAAQDASNGRDCVGALVYVYDHSARRLADRLVNSFHEHHDIALATMHVHLDHDTCMEVCRSAWPQQRRATLCRPLDRRTRRTPWAYLYGSGRDRS